MTSLWPYLSLHFFLSQGISTHEEISCGQSITGITTTGETVSFQFTNDQQQDIHLSDLNSTFIPVLTVKNSNGQYIESAFATDCDTHELADCDGKVFPMTMPNGEYIVEMIPNGNGGAFKVDMMCSNDGFDSMSDGMMYTLCDASW